MKPKNHNVIFKFPHKYITELRTIYPQELKGHTDQQIARTLVLDFYNTDMFDPSYYSYGEIRKLFC